MKTEKICPVSKLTMNYVFSQRVLGKYNIKYYYCVDCGLMQTEYPYWIEEAYQEAISKYDTGVVDRNLKNNFLVEVILNSLSLADGKILDIGGGYGLLTRLLRDRGYDCYTYDKYCSNIFAKDFEPGFGFKADVLLAFEVLEHIENPISFFAEVFNKYNCKTIIFSTLVFKNKIPEPNWWYYAFESGQHITFYQNRTFEAIAAQFECNYYQYSQNIHIISYLKISFMQKMLLNKYLRKVTSMMIQIIRRRKSKIWDDHLLIKKRSQ